jgi:sulfite reductase (ferredoxin)
MSRATSRPQTTWKDRLAGRAPAHLEQEIDAYESQLALKRQGRVDDKLFAESRLRRGVYGQRYDNGQRHDGERTRTLAFPEADLLKGPDTRWHAPGMMRIKIPFGRLDAAQLEVLADLAEEYSDGICHVTTRQDVQLHFVHIEDTPDLMRRLAAVGITTREACGNSVRNVTGCPIAGVCPDEAFDVTPHARALAHFLLGHKDVQGFGRKLKISFSGCAGHACALASMHDLGAVAVTRPEGGAPRRGFALYVGGGLGAVPHQAQLLDGFVPEDELLPVAQAVCRVFARLGEKQNRNKARLKFLVARLGIEELGRLVREERETLPPDERWTAFDDHLAASDEKPSRPPRPLSGDPHPPAFAAWLASNVQDQRQECYTAVTVHLPLGDLTAVQTRRLAAIARRYNGGRVRLTVEQNAVLRWISRGDLPALHGELAAAGLGLPGASSLLDVTACPGTDTCKLGIASSRGLAGELRRRLAERADELDPAVRTLRLKVSGCFNSCGQHHVADIGFYGVSRKKDNRRVPHFQVVLGGQWSENAGAYGLAVAAVPAKRVPEVVDRITGAFAAGRRDGESFQAWVRGRGPAQMRALLEDLTELPAYAAEPELFSDWGDPREYTLGDLGVGECAGEVVSIAEFGLQASERQVFEAQVELDAGRHGAAADKAYRAMLQAAKTLGRTRDLDLADEPDAIVGAFRHGFYDSRLFFDPFAGGKFAHYLFEAHDELAGGNGALGRLGAGDARRRIEEAQLFIEAARACHDRLDEARS